MLQVIVCVHGVDRRFAKCNMCEDPAFHAAQQPTVTGQRLFTMPPLADIQRQWSDTELRKLIREEIERAQKVLGDPRETVSSPSPTTDKP